MSTMTIRENTALEQWFNKGVGNSNSDAQDGKDVSFEETQSSIMK